MEDKTVTLTDDQLEKISSYDRSIDHHCRNCVQLEIQRLGMLEMVQTIESGKKQYIAQLLQESGCDPKTVATAQIDGNDLRVTLKPQG